MLERDDIKKLMAVFQARYGHRWTTAYDDPDMMRIAVGEWYRVLKGFRPEDIRNGLERWTSGWPPTLPEFAQACMPDLAALGYDIEAETERRAPRYHFVMQSAAEEAARRRRREEIRADVEDELRCHAMSEIQRIGVEEVIAIAYTPSPLLSDGD